MVSKGVQQLMKQAIRFYAERTARANRGWMEALQMHWEIAQARVLPRTEPPPERGPFHGGREGPQTYRPLPAPRSTGPSAS